MSTVYREQSISYGAITVGGLNRNVRLDGRYRQSRGPDDGFLEFDILVVEPTQAGFVQRCVEVEANFRTPYLPFSVALGGSTIGSGSQTLSTYLDPRPSIEKIGEVGDTGRSRRYRVRIEYGLPADNVTTRGFRTLDSTVETESSGRRTFRFSGLVTAIGSRDAYQQYNSLIDSVAASIINETGVQNYELVSEPRADVSRNGKTMEFERVYREIIFRQASNSQFDHPNIVEQQFTITRTEDSPGDSQRLPFGGSSTTSGIVRRMARLTLEYTATTRDKSPQDVYQAIRDWLLKKLRDEAKGAMALTIERPQYGPLDDNALRVTLEALAIVDGSEIVQRTVRGTTIRDTIEEVLYAHDGSRHGAFVYDSKGTVTRRIVETTEWAKDVSYADADKRAQQAYGDLKGQASFDGESGKWTKPRIQVETSPIRWGFGSDIINGTRVTVTVDAQFYKKASKSGGTTTAARARG